MADFHIYNGNPTAAGTDGTQVSESAAQTNPVAVTLNKTNAESAAVKLAIRCDSGKQLASGAVLSLSGTNSAKWMLALDNSYTDAAAALSGATWASTITISTAIAATNTIFWAKAMSSTDESVSNDTTVSITATGTVTATA